MQGKSVLKEVRKRTSLHLPFRKKERSSLGYLTTFFEIRKKPPNGAAMPTDEDDHDDNFLYNHPERGGNFAAA